MEKEKFKTGEVIGWFLGGFVGGFIGLVLDGGLGFVLLSVIGALVGIAIGEGGIYNVKIFLNNRYPKVVCLLAGGLFGFFLGCFSGGIFGEVISLAPCLYFQSNYGEKLGAMMGATSGSVFGISLGNLIGSILGNRVYSFIFTIIGSIIMSGIGLKIGAKGKMLGLVIGLSMSSISCIVLKILLPYRKFFISVYDIWWPFIFSTLYLLSSSISIFFLKKLNSF